jgi:lipid II isoglutaminyl synthase (glutamine-hydrolysing)
MQSFRLGRHTGTLLTSKHENSIAYDTNLRYVRQQSEPCTVVLLVDAVSRKYFCGDTSWLWDIDFDLLDAPQVEQVVLCGRHVHDLALRFAHTQVAQEKLRLFDTAQEAAQFLKENGEEPVYLITCFSDRDKFLTHTQSV